MAFEIDEIAAKSIVTPAKVPSADFVINPCTGCQFACMYCSASVMGRFAGESNSNWGNYVCVKINLEPVLRAGLLEHDLKLKYGEVFHHASAEGLVE